MMPSLIHVAFDKARRLCRNDYFQHKGLRFNQFRTTGEGGPTFCLNQRKTNENSNLREPGGEIGDTARRFRFRINMKATAHKKTLTPRFRIWAESPTVTAAQNAATLRATVFHH